MSDSEEDLYKTAVEGRTYSPSAQQELQYQNAQASRRTIVTTTTTTNYRRTHVAASDDDEEVFEDEVHGHEAVGYANTPAAQTQSRSESASSHPTQATRRTPTTEQPSLFPMAEGDLASSMTMMRRSATDPTAIIKSRMEQQETERARLLGQQQEHLLQYQHDGRTRGLQAAPVNTSTASQSRSKPRSGSAAMPPNYRSYSNASSPVPPSADPNESGDHLSQSMLSFNSNGSSAGAGLLEMARIQTTMKEASHKMDHYIGNLQSTITSRDAELQALRSQMAQMERNYEYNLDIIRERDEALQSAGVMIEQKHRALKAAEDKCRRAEERLLDQERSQTEGVQAAKQREVLLEGEVRAAQRKVEEMELRHQHSLHDRDQRLERERAEMRKNHELRSKAEDEARAAVIHRLEKAISDAAATAKKREVNYEHDMEALRSKHLEAERRITSLSEQLRIALVERDSTKEKLAHTERGSYEELEHHKSVIAVLEKRALEAEGSLSRTAKESEAAVRLEASKVATLSADLAAAKATAAAFEQRFVSVQGQRQTDAAAFTVEIERIKTVMRSQLEESEEHRTHALSRTEVAITAEQTMELNLKELRRTLDEKLKELAEAKAKAIDLERRWSVAVKQTQLLEERLFDHQSTANAGADDWKNQRLMFEENEREFGRKWDRLVREQATERERYHQTISSLQQDYQSLQREFNVSESSRQALQEQLSLLDDSHNGPRKTIDSLRLQNKDLSEKVVMLEKSNETIRKQVQLFTEEMHNDPVIRQAKEQAEQIAILEASRAEQHHAIEGLQAALSAKDEEVSRYQLQILTTKVEHESELRTAKSETKARDEGVALAVLEGKALKEHELWHKKALQLEVVVQKMLKERQQMADEMERMQHKLGTAVKERASLTEANTVLRVQLEESYAEHSRAVSNARAASIAQSYREGNGAPSFTNVQSPNPMPAPSAVGAVAREQAEKLEALEHKIQMMRAKEIGSHQSGRKAAPSTSRSRSQPSEAAPVVRGRGGNTVRHYGFGQ